MSVDKAKSVEKDEKTVAKASAPAKTEAPKAKAAVSVVDELRAKRANYDLVSGSPVNPPREAVSQAPIPQVIERDGVRLELVSDGQNTHLSLGGQKLQLDADGVRELAAVTKRRVNEL